MLRIPEKKGLPRDRDGKFSEKLRDALEETGVASVRLPPRSPDLTPRIERFRRSLKNKRLGEAACVLP